MSPKFAVAFFALCQELLDTKFSLAFITPCGVADMRLLLTACRLEPQRLRALMLVLSALRGWRFGCPLALGSMTGVFALAGFVGDGGNTSVEHPVLVASTLTTFVLS